jgi:hypothetical protein
MNAQGPPKPRPEWAVGCGPEWCIVQRGHAYRVEKRNRTGNHFHWDSCPNLQYPFLFMARWRMRREVAKERLELSKGNVVEYAD